jgi:hypothetical protein
MLATPGRGFDELLLDLEGLSTSLLSKDGDILVHISYRAEDLLVIMAMKSSAVDVSTSQ